MEEEKDQKQATTEEIGKKFINLEKVIADKNPRLLKFIPGFVIRYLKRVIHQDEVNAAIYEYRDRMGINFVNAILFDTFKIDFKEEGKENIPQEGRFLLSANHPLGGLDGMALMSSVGSVRPDVLFPVNDLLMHLPQMRSLFIPINKHGSNLQNFRLFEQTFASEKPILYFPAGLCSRKRKGEVVDLEWKKTFINQARKHKRDLVPTYVSGKNSKFFYRLANIRKFIGIKANIEMLYLVDEMFKQKDKPLKIVYGKPIPWETFDKRFSDNIWAIKVKKHVYNLAENKNLEFDPEI
jgi:1-acyl-sn-glycerol-3-phosphate acyltransferase